MSGFAIARLSPVALKQLSGVEIEGGAVLPLAASISGAASVRKEFIVDAPVDFVWDALRDFGALHTRLARGFVEHTQVEGATRIVSFTNGFEAREVLIALEDETVRVVYSAAGGRIAAHCASAQLFAEPNGKTRFVWSADFLPREVEPVIAGMMQEGVEAMKKTLEEDARR